ncbi:aureobasidin A1 biosynthesis complex [Colletotrichum higginsianum]|uniref:Aureobasidin A1 biosynthesis complex n=1 Tax=Colletotrichum higginsianum (strain IMI 349063) TaxID=759273 RepID=H1V4T8_COLHI|nr:aureobasidin A1 biosynthesis complex [Colletotrichum higginsianum]
MVPISDTLRDAPSKSSIQHLPKPTATSLAYIIFTSGSTGRPKGVMVEHRGIIRLVKNSNVVAKLPPAARVAHLSNVAFDASTWEIYSALLNGGTLVCIDYFTTLDPAALNTLFLRERIQATMLPPALLKQCLKPMEATLGALSLLFAAGDRFDGPDAAAASRALVSGSVYNAYGPTENTILSTIYEVSGQDPFVNGVPIGRAVSNSGAYILDPSQQPVPVGVMGELVVTGDGLARGYTDAALNKDRFAQVAVNGQVVRAYRTGDRVRYRPTDGQIEFFGRMDQQVKIRGHRVEPAEVEQALLTHADVLDAAVVLRRQEGEETEMIGFVAARGDQSLETQEAGNQVEGWGNHFETSTYADIETIDQSVVGNDFMGWTSMYDGKDIDKGEMQEWLDDTMAALHDGRPAGRVLEIGTGTGMILFNLRGLEGYVGLDPSSSAAGFVNGKIRAMPSFAGKARVAVGTALDVGNGGLLLDNNNNNNNNNMVDAGLVVTNSVAQYFPSGDYLFQVIEHLTRLRGVRRLFFGDMRTYATNRDFLAARALHDLGSGATRDDVQRRIAELEEREEELLVDPAFFTGLVARLPDHVWHVEILPKRMRATNELSAYRYAAVVHMKNPEDDETKEKTRRQPVHAIETDAWIDFKKSQLDSAGLLNLLKSKSKSSSSTIVPVANIPYSKTIVERLLVESLDEDDETQRLLDGAPWISSIRDLARSYAALSGADLADVADQAGFRVELSWARQRSQNGAIDAVFHRRHLIGDDDHNNHKNHQQQTRVLFDFPTEHLGRLSNLLANSPLQRHQSRRLETQVRDHLQTILPPYMVPVQIVVMDRLPLNANGKIDRRELARKARAAPRTKALLAATERVEPRNEVEAALCDEFSAVLGVDVGITDNFFDLGGHSLMATRLAARLSRRLNTQISVKDVFDNARIVDLAASIRQGSSRHNAIRALPYTGPVEQSFAQGRLWFLDQLDLGASWYIMPLAVRLRGPLDVEALASAFRALELRHETLRTTFEEQDGIGVQVVHPYDPKDPLRIIHVQDGGSHLDEALRKEQSLPFDLSTEPGWRPALLRVGDGDQDHVLSIVMHHIIYDGWSLEILQRELASFYASAARGQDPLAHVPTLAIQYRDFAAWQRQEEQIAEHERQLSYWRQQLEGSQPASLFCDRPRPAALSGDAGIESVVVEGPTYENLQAYCRARQATPFIVLLAAFRAAHYRLTGMEDATVGTPIANRNRSELEDLVGFFVNTQCMRITIDEADETFESLVQQVRATVNTSFENQDVPFERIVSALQPGSRDTSRNPLVQLMFAVHSQQGLGGIQLEDVSSERLPNATTTRFDVEFHLFQEKGRLTGSIVYATDLFAPASIRGVVSVFQEVLRRTLDDPKAVLSSLPLTDGLAELHSKGLLSIPRSPYPRDASVADVFRELALSQPDAPAVVDASSTLSYSQLDQQSDTLAAWLLRRRDMADEALVGVLAPRSCDTIVAFLGILKANMAYLPLDINAPVARLNAIFSTRPGRKLLLLGNDTPVPDSLAEDVETVRLGEALKTSLAIPPTASKPSATSLASIAPC